MMIRRVFFVFDESTESSLPDSKLKKSFANCIRCRMMEIFDGRGRMMKIFDGAGLATCCENVISHGGDLSRGYDRRLDWVRTS